MSEALLTTPKLLPDDLDWRPHPTHPGVQQIESGVIDPEERRIQGLVVVLSILTATHGRAGESWVFRLDEVRPGKGEARNSLYRLELRHRPGIPADHHDAPHAHRIGVRMTLDPSAWGWTWTEALRYFCDNTALAVPQIAHPFIEFKLKP